MRPARIIVVAVVLAASACGGPTSGSEQGVSEAATERSDRPDEAILRNTTTTSPPTDRVAPPEGVLGPLTVDAVDPETAGIEWDGSKYEVPEGFTWDEITDGGHLLFDKGRVLIVGDDVSISGAVFDTIDSGNNTVVQGGAGVGPYRLSHFTVAGGTGSSAVGGSIGRGDGSEISNFSIVGFDGDGMKPPIGSTITDGYIHLSQREGSALHYDGVQITGRSGITLGRLRFRLEGDDNLNAAIFVHDGVDGSPADDTTIFDIDIEHAPATWYPLRLTSGSVSVRNVVGRGPMSPDGRRPRALIWHEEQGGIDWSTVHPDFDGEVAAGRSPR